MRERFFETVSMLRDIISNKSFYLRFPPKSRAVLKQINEELEKVLSQKYVVTEGYLLDTDSDFANQYRNKYQESVHMILKVMPLLYKSAYMVSAEASSLNKLRSVYDNLKNFDESFQMTMYSMYRLD